MVTVVLRGGLGNQMFEYAAGLSLSLDKGVPLVVDTTYLNDHFPRHQFTRRAYDLDIFTLTPAFTRLSTISSSIPIPGVWLGIDLLLLAANKMNGSPKDVRLWGFFQGERYFEKHRDAVRDSFRFRDPLEGAAAAIAETIKKENSVSIHVRRGDYLLPKYQSLYGATDISYYDRAIAYVADRVASPHFFIFSDDIAWCRGNLKPPGPTTYVDDASKGPKASFHLHLMSLCKHNIIANSSFSWWGAWLNQNSEKLVVGPRQWYVNEGESQDILLPEWIKI